MPESSDADAARPLWARIPLWQTVRGAVFGSVLGALLIAILDARGIAAAGGSFRIALAVFGAASLLGIVSAISATAAVALLGAFVVGLERVRVDVFALLGALVVATLTVLGAQALVLEVLSGQGIRTAVVALSAAIGVVVGAVIGSVAGRTFTRAPSVRARAAGIAFACMSLFVWVIAFAPGLVTELDVPGLVFSSVPFLIALVAALRGLSNGRVLRASIGVWVLLFALAAAHAVTPVPRRLAIYVARETDATRVVLDALRQLTPNKLAPLRAAGTCHPGIKPGPLRGQTWAHANAPNILFLTIDALRWDHTTLAGYERDTTPALARFAKSAAVFSSAHSPASSTRQTFRSLFSGLFPSQVRPSKGPTWWGLTFPSDQRTLASYLKDAGYLTVAGSDRGEGFDPKQGGALIGFERSANKRTTKETQVGRAKRPKQQIADLIEEFKAPHDKPLFAWAHITTAHQPYTVDKPSKFGNKEVDRYDWAVRFVDAQVGRLLEALSEQRAFANTYVVISADHGQAFGEHGNRLHGRTVYQEETHVPLLVWGPDVVAGIRKAPVAVIDVFPTLLELAGLGTAEAVCGTSFANWLRDPRAVPERDIYIEQTADAHPEFAIAFIHKGHKLIVTPRTCTMEVFDVIKDPRDRHDLGDDLELTDRLVDALKSFMHAHALNPRSYCLE